MKLVTQIIIWTLCMIILAFYLVVHFAGADINSINSFGDTETVMTPEDNIEGFFFGNIPSVSTSSGGGGLSPIYTANVSNGSICERYNFTDKSDLQRMINDLNLNESEKNELLNLCNPTPEKYSYFWLILIMALFLTVILSRKRISKMFALSGNKITKNIS